MNLYLRLFFTLWSALRRPRLGALDESVTRWRVWPTDLDAFGHMNNARYLAIMDLARIEFVIRLGLLGLALRERWKVPVVSAHLDFLGGLRPWQRYTVHTRAEGWDERAFYLRQEFRDALQPERVLGVGRVRVVFRGRQGPLRPEEIMRLAGSPALHSPRMEPQTAAIFGCAPPPAPPVVRPREPLAIVGIGCRLPGGASDPDALLQLLLEGRDCIVDIPASRWDPRKYHDPTGRSPGRSYVQRAGLLSEDPFSFDAAFFGISPREAATLDPQQRILLEVSYEALEHAGIPQAQLAGSRTGVFVGGFMMDSLLIQSNPTNRELIGAQSATASTLTMLSNRLSYLYDLRGPSVSIDTACSSSLVALHMACQSVWSGESEAALVGGANVLLVPETQVTMAKGRFLSPRGRCHAFSDQADGYVRAEGAAVVVLKPLSAAQRDGNPVLALVLGTAVNQDGRTAGITLPNQQAQIAVMREAYAQAGVDPREVGYVEAHGTGTPAGDPIEAGAIGTVLGASRPTSDPCLMGSIKTNLGHLEAAAGITGVIKAALCVQRGLVPPHLHLQRVNPEIPLDALGLQIPTG
jgi:3-oxoacyl-(acyl-carrier-protein) synthase/acyl-CoA thioesterase FadM